MQDPHWPWDFPVDPPSDVSTRATAREVRQATADFRCTLVALLAAERDVARAQQLRDVLSAIERASNRKRWWRRRSRR